MSKSDFMNRIAFVKTHKGELKPENPRFLNLDNYAQIDKISSPDDSASGSYVYVARDKEGNGVVLKITNIDSYDYRNLSYTYPEMEAKIYKVTNKLVENNITPHIFMLMDSLNPTFIDKNHDFYNIIKHESYVSAMTLETFHKKDKLVVFDELIDVNYMTEAIMFNLLFQILYTLEAFNMIGLRHNDLHSGNIMVIKTPGIKGRCNKYILANGTSVRLPYIGYDTRIFDFDRSCKLGKRKSGEEILMPDDSFKKYHQKCDYNTKFDTYKILGYVHKYTKLKGIRQFIESCFPSKELIKTGTLKGRTYNNKFNGKRYYQIKWKPVDKSMLPTSTILSRLADKVHEPSCESIIETYSLGSIAPYKKKQSLKSRVSKYIPLRTRYRRSYTKNKRSRRRSRNTIA